MRTRLREEHGASAVEFAFIVPLLLVLVLGIAEFGHAFQVQGTLSAAAREGARVMALQNDPVAARSAVRDASPTLVPAVTDAQVTVAPATCPTTGTANVRVTVAYPMPFLTDFFGADIDLTGTGVMRCNG
ncbi:TadE/TadG family type IV pilus assembly protein [Geodermatophilus sp. DSM 44513]|uniref:TadE/TadG family type IV pilus assembly protein n=1 Tax=Geodermatophilus sp. DSM 44513 TaxID=1528104 RepID=UPI00126F457F|nr:TadE/TadG family type IV pilus assembly protein [Geodermatophilus sp. DSM 44513]WNV77219.1 TadE/TadG family type IV pilus assembly protein [Geodermatophilus sp. DSM 44513]